MRNVVFAEILHPAMLVFLQLVTRTLDFDQAIPALRRKMDEVGKAGAVVAQIDKDTIEDRAPVCVFNPLQGEVNQFERS